MIVLKPVRIDLARPARTVVHCMQTDNTQRVDVSLFVNNRPYDVTADVASGDTVSMAVAYILPNGFGDQYTETALGETAVEQDSTIAHLYHVMIDGACTDVDGFVQIIVKFTTDGGQVLNSFPLTLDVIKSRPDDVDPDGGSPETSRYLRKDLQTPATEDMTKPVGVTPEGLLVTAPGGGGGGSVTPASIVTATGQMTTAQKTSTRSNIGAAAASTVDAIADKIPSAASASNQLADKEWVLQQGGSGSETMTVAIVEQGGGYTPSETFTAIYAAYEAGKTINLVFGDLHGNLNRITEGGYAIFEVVDTTDPANLIKYVFTISNLGCYANKSRYVPNPAGGTAQNPSADKGKVPTVGNTGEYELKAVTPTADDVLNAAEDFTTGQQNSFRGFIRAEEAGAAAAVQTNLSAVTAKIPSAATESNQLADKAWVTGMVGAPKKAATVADMVDTDSIYVYTGSETGYVAGNWYYYEQGSWVSGGVYNAVAFTTDATLTQPGAAADAAATGTAIGNVFTPAAKRKLLSILRNIDAWLIANPDEEIDDLEDLLFPGGEAVSIDAVFAQSGNVIYDNDDLDVLRQYLTVTAEDAQGVTTTITDYALTGTLTAGTSTITVTHGNLSDTFTVAVTLNDVRFCEWIQTEDNTNWIKTDLKPADTIGYKIQLLPLVQSSGILLGTRDNSQRRYWTYVENNAIYVGWNTSLNTQKTYTAGTPFTIEVNYKNSRKVKVNNVDTGLSLSTLPTIDWYIALLGRNLAGDYAGVPQKFYGIEFTSGQSAARNYVPAYKTSNGEIGVYDKLSHTFFGNNNTSGTATGFTKGADV